MMQQLSLKAGMNQWGDRAKKAVHLEMKQLHFKETFKPVHKDDLTKDELKCILESHLFLKEKRDGKIKGRMVAGGNKQRNFISKEESSPLMMATEATYY